MSALNSNLSTATYHYDLVSALSQDALNVSLKDLLKEMGDKNLPPVTEYYKFNDMAFHSPSAGTSLMTPEEVQAMTGGIDPFTIPNNTNSSTTNATYKALGDAMASSGFAYAFEVTFGLPEGVSSLHLPDVITLHNTNDYDKNQTVTYNAYFQTFKIMELTYGYGSWSVSQVSQADSSVNPWVFQWQVDLNISLPNDVKFNDLPDNVQQNLRNVDNMNTSTMFSMQQLLLDLNTPQLIPGGTPPPSVIGFVAGDPLYNDLNTFIANYWTILSENGGVVFNTSLKPVSVAYPPSSIIPTALNFVVSPYSGGTQGLYTLNYLVMSDGRSLPNPITPFNWDWVNDDSIQGIMSVRRDLFIDYLNKALSPALAKICYNPNVDVDFDGSCRIWMTPASPSPVYNAHTNNPVLDFSFSKEGHDEAGLIGALFQVTVDVNISSNVSFNGNKIIVSTIMSVYADIYTALAHTKGYALATQNVTTFTMDGVGASQSNSGVLSIIASVANTNLVQNNDKNGAY